MTCAPALHRPPNVAPTSRVKLCAPNAPTPSRSPHNSLRHAAPEVRHALSYTTYGGRGPLRPAAPRLGMTSEAALYWRTVPPNGSGRPTRQPERT